MDSVLEVKDESLIKIIPNIGYLVVTYEKISTVYLLEGLKNLKGKNLGQLFFAKFGKYEYEYFLSAKLSKLVEAALKSNQDLVDVSCLFSASFNCELQKISAKDIRAILATQVFRVIKSENNQVILTLDL